MSSIDRQQHIEKILRDLIDLLPDSYNKEVTDTNYYKLLRSLALELSDTKVQVDAVRKNNYLETVGPDAIQNNFGTLVKLEKLPEWDDEKYRDLVKGVIQSLLIGPTKNSLIQAFKMFTSFDVKVHELYKDSDKVDPSVYEGYNKKFTFLLEIEKPLDVFADNKVLQRDANYIIGILKPAHTIGLQIINLTDSEDFRLYYGIDKKINNLSSAYTDEKIYSEIDKFISQKVAEQVNEPVISNQNSNNETYDTIYIRNYGIPERKYKTFLDINAEKLYKNYLLTFDKKATDLNTNEELMPLLDLKYFKNIAASKLKEKYSNVKNMSILSNKEINGATSYDVTLKINNSESGTASVIFNSNSNISEGYLIEVDIFNDYIKLLNIKDKFEIATFKLNNSIEVGEEFNLKILLINNNDVEIHLQVADKKTHQIPILNPGENPTPGLIMKTNLLTLKNNYFGFLSYKSFLEIKNVKVNNVQWEEVVYKDNEEEIKKNKHKNQFIGSSENYYADADFIKYLIIPGMITEKMIISLKQELYVKSNSSLTLTKLKQKLNLEKEKLKEIYLLKGHDPSLISDSEWEKRTIESLKVDLLRDYMLERLGGKQFIHVQSLNEANKFRDDYEQLYDNYTPYLGMDKLEVESNSDNNDGKFGWKHISYAGQLTTSISMKGSKIGGTDLIGPRYTLYDNHSLDSVNQYSEKIDLKSHAIFQLNKSTLNGKFILNSNNEKDVETSWARMPNEDEYKPANMEEDVTDIDVDLTDTYEFANIGFVLASGMLNVTNYAIEEVEKYEAKLDLVEESYDSINRTKDVSDINMENQDVIDILGIENEDDIVIEQELSDDFYMSPTRGFMLNVDALGNMNVIPSSLVSPEKIEKEVELTEFIGLSSKNYTPFKLNSATLNNSSGSILGTFKFDTAEGFLSKIDSNGNEIILETRVM